MIDNRVKEYRSILAFTTPASSFGIELQQLIGWPFIYIHPAGSEGVWVPADGEQHGLKTKLDLVSIYKRC